MSKINSIKKVLKTLNEAPIDYGDRPERMSPDIEQNLANRQTPFSDHPAMPDVDPNGIPSDYPEFMASKRFKDVIQDVMRFTGVRTVPTQGRNALMTMQRVLMEVVYRILDLEDGHREELEQLAVELVKQEFGINDDDYQWDVKIIDIRNPEQKQEMEEKIQEMNEMPEEEQEMAVEEAIDGLNTLELEKAKRRFMNAMVQGSAQKMNQAYYLVQTQLDQISPELTNLYGAMMATNDLQYWILPDEMIEGLAGAGSGAGTEEIDNETDPPTIRARGINFPTLVHEITKAVMDAIATHGLPEDPVQARKIIDSEDTLPKETWDLRLGPVIWEKFRDAYPEQLYDEDRRRIQAHLIMEFAQLPADEFMELAQEILSGSNRGKQRLNQIVQGILESINQENLEDFENRQDQPPEGDEGDNAGEERPFDPTDPSTWE